MAQISRRLPQMYEHFFRARPSPSISRTLSLQNGPRPSLARISSRNCNGWLESLRTLSSSFQATSASPSHRKSDGGEASEIKFAADQPAELPNRLSKLSAWTLSSSKMGITRQFTFPTFAAAWRFMCLVADECKIKRHHPSWSNLYNQVTIEWTTHKPKGLSIKDVEMAEFCDRTADEIGLKMQNQKNGTANS